MASAHACAPVREHPSTLGVIETPTHVSMSAWISRPVLCVCGLAERTLLEFMEGHVLVSDERGGLSVDRGTSVSKGMFKVS